MSASDFLTTRQVAEILGQPDWRIRRIVDRLNGIGRIGGRRIIPREKLAEILDAIRALDAKPQEAAS
jgi:hypothetical protein